MDEKTKIERRLKKLFDFPKATKKEKEEWPFKSELKVSPSFLIGKKLFYKNLYVGIIQRIENKKHRTGFFLITKNGKFDLTNSKFECYNPFYKKNYMVELHPSRNGKKFWSLGYVITESDYKKEYYKTVEYRFKYEKTLNDNLKTIGLKAPIQNKKTKEKIKKTIKERYGVDWFLERGGHYSAVTQTMINSYGVENLFLDTNWQRENSKNNLKNNNDSSKLEKEIIKEIVNFGLEESHYKGSSLGMKIVNFDTHFFKLDFYNEKHNIVIEVMGDYWHCNPLMYEQNYFNKNKEKFAYEIWKKDFSRKIEITNKLNCHFIEIWENDWNENKENVLSFVKSFIK